MRVQSFQFDARVVGGNLPVDGRPRLVAPVAVGPRGGELLHRLAVRHAAAQGLPRQDTLLDLGHI